MSEDAQQLWTRDDLLPELDYLRVQGLASFDMARVRRLARLAVATGFGEAGNVSTFDIRRFLQLALGLLDRDAIKTSAACLYGLDDDQNLSATLAERTEAARQKSGLKERAYRNRQKVDMQMVADSLISVWREALERRADVERQRKGTPPAPSLVSVDPPKEVAVYLQDKSGEDWLADRQQESAQLWTEILIERDKQIAAAGGSLSQKLCMFASGSYGRGEAMPHSDLDLFLVDDALGTDPEISGKLNKWEQSAALTVIDRMRIERGIQRFSQGGYYQETQSFRQMVSLASRDAEQPTHSTTALSLLLVNSKCLWNEELYRQMRDSAMDNYWRDNVGIKRRLCPTYLINDLRRLWLTMLVDFERFYSKDSLDGQRFSGPLRRIAELKLALPQMLGCYTPLLGILECSTNEGLLRTEAQEVLDMTTGERLDRLAASENVTISGAASALRTLYGQYLGFSWCGKDEMLARVIRDDWPIISTHFHKANSLILLMLWTYYAKIPDITRLILV